MSRLPGFPVPIKNEAIQSVIARHIARSAGSAHRVLSTIGLNTSNANRIIPNNICVLSRKLPPTHPWFDSAPSIILDHSMLPLFLQFAKPENYKSTINKISSGASKNPTAALGLTRPSGRLLIENNYRFCPECLQRDLHNLGFPIYYRHHLS